MRSIPHRLTRSAPFAGGGARFRPNFFAPLQDSGAGAVNAALALGLGTATFTRATTAWTKLSTGLWASVASGTARSCYLGADTTVGAYGGYFAEVAATNLCLQARDLTNASWTKVNCTAAKDQAGIDGTASSASSLTATAGSATCLQTITEAATASAFSCFVKRITGTGTITIQQTATTVDITALINSSTYTRVEVDATVLNPVIGINISTNGDKIAVDMCQFENTVEKATSPIPTTTIAVVRNKDQLTYTGFDNSATPLTLYCEAAQFVDGAGRALGISDGTANNESSLYFTVSQLDCRVVTGGVIQADVAAASYSINTIYKLAGRAQTNNVNAWANGSPGTADTSATMPATTTIGIAQRGNAANQLNGTIKNVKIWTRALTDIQIAGL